MFTLDLDKLTPERRAMVALWEEHMKAEFQDKDARASCDTMVANPYVNHVPVLYPVVLAHCKIEERRSPTTSRKLP